MTGIHNIIIRRTSPWGPLDETIGRIEALDIVTNSDLRLAIFHRLCRAKEGDQIVIETELRE